MLRAYEHAKQSENHSRKPYARRKFKLAFEEKRSSNRKMSISRGLEAPLPSLKGKHTSVLQNLFKASASVFDDVKSVRKISE